MRLVILLSLSALATPSAHALGILIHLPDEFDDHALIASVSQVQTVSAFRKQMDDFKERLRQRKESEIVAMFGKPRPKPAQTFAMPVAQHRGFGMSGLRHA